MVWRFVRNILLVVLLIPGCSGEKGESPQTEAQAPAGSHAKTGSLSKTAAGEIIAIENLVAWQFLGSGEVKIDDAEKAVFMTETQGSKGVTLVSPQSYEANTVVSFKVKPATYESVNVVILSASDKDTGGDIHVPADYDGSFGFWTEQKVQDYVFAFHNGAHNRKPFITKCPGSRVITEAQENVASERWHDIEIGRHGSKLWLKIDGATVVEGTDPDEKALPGGKIGLRLRGTPDSIASAWFKDLMITSSEQ